MEYIIFHSIMDHLNTHNVINPNQHVTPNILLVDDISKVMDSHYLVDLVLFGT